MVELETFDQSVLNQINVLSKDIETLQSGLKEKRAELKKATAQLGRSKGKEPASLRQKFVYVIKANPTYNFSTEKICEITGHKKYKSAYLTLLELAKKGVFSKSERGIFKAF